MKFGVGVPYSLRLIKMTVLPVPSAADLFNVDGLVAVVTGAGGGSHLSFFLYLNSWLNLQALGC